MTNPHSAPATAPYHPRGDSRHLSDSSSPTPAELTDCLFFSPEDGRIWLNDQRMLLLHSSSFGALRRKSSSVWGWSRRAVCSPVPAMPPERGMPG